MRKVKKEMRGFMLKCENKDNKKLLIIGNGFDGQDLEGKYVNWNWKNKIRHRIDVFSGG